MYGTRNKTTLWSIFKIYIIFCLLYCCSPSAPNLLVLWAGMHAGEDYLSQWRSTMVSTRTERRSFSVFFSLHSCYQRLGFFFFFFMIDVVITKVKCWSFDNWLIKNVPLNLLDCMCGAHMKIIWYLVSIANQYVMHILQLIFLSN